MGVYILIYIYTHFLLIHHTVYLAYMLLEFAMRRRVTCVYWGVCELTQQRESRSVGFFQ